MEEQKMKTEEERLKHEKKMTGYLSLFNFLLTFLVGYYYGFHYAAVLASLTSLIIGYTRDESEIPLYKQVWSLASPFVFVILIGFINPSVVPVGISGVLFTAIGLHVKTLNQGIYVKLIILGTAFILALYGGLVQYPRYVQSVLAQTTHEQLPNFSIRDLDGNQIYLSELKGKVVLVDYWATWCKPCRDEFVELEEVVKHYKENDKVVFLITNAKGSGDTLEKIQNFVQSNSYQLPFYIDDTGLASQAVNVSAFPTLALIDKNGTLRIHHTGYSNAENLKDYLIEQIDALIQE
ncbi:TlpA family protein disulfide reductase [bacterium SCSIO 12643]|nr:TlpA family protein disulfide reductase [bacterium SCSIO 12643]